MDNKQIISYLEKEGRDWVVSQRNAYKTKGHSIELALQTNIEPFFQISTLRKVSLCEVHQIENPLFYRELEKQGISMPLDFRTMAGITFIDTVLIAPSKIGATSWTSLVFHECVHVVQYLFLNVDKFVHEYVTSWANNNFEYSKISLEIQAYQLQQLFDSSPQNIFSVEKEIAKKWG